MILTYRRFSLDSIVITFFVPFLTYKVYLYYMLFLLLLGCQFSTQFNSVQVFEDFKVMHQSVYEVYRNHLTPEELHTQLSHTFSGTLLTREYIEHFTTQHHMQYEETAIDIRQIDYNDIVLLDHDYNWLMLDADWSVGGVVTHQGHKHTRINRYRAVYTLEQIMDVGWRITDVKMRNAERIRRASDADLLSGDDAGGGYLDALDLLDAGMMLEPEQPDSRGQKSQENLDEEDDTGVRSIKTMKFEGFE